METDYRLLSKAILALALEVKRTNGSLTVHDERTVMLAIAHVEELARDAIDRANGEALRKANER